MEETQRKLAAILAADVVGYSRLMGEDEANTLAALREWRAEAFEPTVSSNRGNVVKSMGDGWLVEFASAGDAVACAIQVQEQLSDHEILKLRIGVHIGDITHADDDIYGDGVNIAARLQEIAETGAFVISDMVRRILDGKLAENFSDLGQLELKNIAEPITAYGWNMTKVGKTIPALALPDKPSIAVLPFENMSGDPEQEYFTDGIVEEITAALSKVRTFFVVARNSSFTFKGKHTEIRQVSRQLGVRYVLEGSVRKSANRVRITAQLIDAENDQHVWADQYDGTLDDIFDLQDQITESVVGAIEPKLRSSEIERARRKPTTNLNAYDHFLRALPHAHSMTQDGNEEALKLTSMAVALDPRFASAMALAAWCYTLRIANGWVDSMHKEAPEAIRLARAAVDIDKDVPETLWLAGYVLGYFGKTPQEGIDLIDDALRLNPNSAEALVYSGWLKAYNGDASTAKAQFERAMRLSPLDTSAYRTYAGLAYSYFFFVDFDDAVSWGYKGLHHNPKFTPTHRVLAASLGQAGRLEEARQIVDQLQALLPGFTVSRYGEETRFRVPEYFELLMDGVRKAGLPEQ